MSRFPVPLSRLVGRVKREVNTWKGLEIRVPVERFDHVERLGTYYGGWHVLADRVNASSVVYGVGVGHDASWDLAMIERFGCTVHAFDPTPRSVEWVASQKWPEKFAFHPWGLATFDGEATFVMPNADPTWSSYVMNAADGTPKHEEVRVPVRRLDTIMRELGHPRVDVIKIDIEGAEYDVLDDLVSGSLRPGQILAEFHYWHDRPAVERFRRNIDGLRRVGYRAFARSPHGPEISFVHTGT